MGIATNANMTQGHIFNGTFHNNSLGVSLERFHTKALYLSSKISPHLSNDIKVNKNTSMILKNSFINSHSCPCPSHLFSPSRLYFHKVSKTSLDNLGICTMSHKS